VKVAKKYIAKEEITTYSVNTIEIVAESENEAMDILRNGEGTLIDTEIQEEVRDARWIDSSEPLSVSEFMELTNA
tara:strand:- start:202 stop:426 length:225 start_codon:yes stop_codon:yes gene_type:complete